MSKKATAPGLALGARPKSALLSRWLYDELRNAILDGRLKRTARLPATRELALQCGVSRGTVVTVFDQLQAEGYILSRTGSGTVVSDRLPEDLLHVPHRRIAVAGKPHRTISRPACAFRLNEPALDQFPVDSWTRVASRRLRVVSRELLGNGDARGYAPLRQAVSEYLGASRGVRCSAEQVIIVSGVQHALDLLARVILKPGNQVWLEDPGYPGARVAFERAGVKAIAIPVDQHGLDVESGRRMAPSARAVYVTPAHHFPLGMAMPLDRRLALLEWARRSGAVVIEDDYDSEYRFSGRPIPALQGLDRAGSVIFTGSFNKVLFPSLRLGYLVLPPRLVEPIEALRLNVDRFSPTIDQAILCDFIREGFFARHIRRMRELYAGRLAALVEAVRKEMGGLLEIPLIEAGLQSAALLHCGITSREATRAAAARGIETVALDRFCVRRRIHGLLLGFAAIDVREIRRGVSVLAAAIEPLARSGDSSR